MSNGNYSWEEVMLGIDVKAEERKERQETIDRDTERRKETNAASAWSLGLSVIGAALFGPVGYFLGKQAGKWGADYVYDWESMDISEGKFKKEQSRQYNEMMDKAATDTDIAQAVSTVTDLASMWIQAGGLTTKPGDKTDLFTFGSGEGEWSVLSDESFLGKGVDIPFTDWNLSASTLPKGKTLFTGGYKPVASLKDALKVSEVASYIKGKQD